MSSSPKEEARDGLARLLAGWTAGSMAADLRRAWAAMAERERGRECAKWARRESGYGRSSKRARARGRASWMVSTARARTWVSDGLGEDGADRAGPPRSERERARGRTVHDVNEAGPQR
jgi:hypothetical protein